MQSKKKTVRSHSVRRPQGRLPSGGDVTRAVSVSLRASQIREIDAIADRDGVSRSRVLRGMVGEATRRE